MTKVRSEQNVESEALFLCWLCSEGEAGAGLPGRGLFGILGAIGFSTVRIKISTGVPQKRLHVPRSVCGEHEHRMQPESFMDVPSLKCYSCSFNLIVKYFLLKSCKYFCLTSNSLWNPSVLCNFQIIICWVKVS